MKVFIRQLSIKIPLLNSEISESDRKDNLNFTYSRFVHNRTYESSMLRAWEDWWLKRLICSFHFLWNPLFSTDCNMYIRIWAEMGIPNSGENLNLSAPISKNFYLLFYLFSSQKNLGKSTFSERLLWWVHNFSWTAFLCPLSVFQLTTFIIFTKARWLEVEEWYTLMNIYFLYKLFGFKYLHMPNIWFKFIRRSYSLLCWSKNSKKYKT